MANATIAAKYITNPRNTWDGTEKIPLDVAGSDGVGLASTLSAYVTGGGALAITAGKTLTVNKTLTLAGTDGTTMTFPTTSASIARTDAAQTLTGIQTFAGNIVPDADNTRAIGTASAAFSNGFFGTNVRIGSAGVYYFINRGEFGTSADGTFFYRNSAETIQTFFTIPANATWQFGAADTASPAAQITAAQSVATGTADTAGANWTVNASRGTGAGAGGSLIFQTAPAHGSDSVQGTLAAALTIDSTGTTTLGVVSSRTGKLSLANSASANLTTIQAGNAANARTYTWPTDFGAAGTVLTDAAGNGTLSWAAGGGGAGLGANTFTALQTITQASANAGILASTGYSLTGSNATNMLDFAGTWNTSGVVTALRVAMTVTAAGAGSKLFDFIGHTTGAVSLCSLTSVGALFVGPPTGSTAKLQIRDGTAGINWGFQAGGFLGGGVLSIVHESQNKASMHFQQAVAGVSGSVIVGDGALATTATIGYFYIPTCAGTPTGVPATFTGRIAMVYDTTAHQFWFYDGSWLQPKTPAGAATVTWQ